MHGPTVSVAMQGPGLLSSVSVYPLVKHFEMVQPSTPTSDIFDGLSQKNGFDRHTGATHSWLHNLDLHM